MLKAILMKSLKRSKTQNFYNFREGRLVFMINKQWYYQVAAFLLGVVVCGEIFYIFTINNTYIELSNIYSLILLSIFFAKDYKKVIYCFRKYYKIMGSLFI